MKSLKRFASGVALALTLLVAVPATQTGCSTTQKEAAYKTLEVVVDGVDLLYRAYADAVVAGKVSFDTQRIVRDAKRRYEVALVAAVDLARGDYSRAAPEDVIKLADELSAALRAAIGGH